MFSPCSTISCTHSPRTVMLYTSASPCPRPPQDLTSIHTHTHPHPHTHAHTHPPHTHKHRDTVHQRVPLPTSP